jgi:hypothetical protein
MIDQDPCAAAQKRKQDYTLTRLTTVRVRSLDVHVRETSCRRRFPNQSTLENFDYTGISVRETERYVAAPGQACAYMIGQLKFLELREKAERELGNKFSLKEFHNVILRTGMVPLEVLEEVVDDYIRIKK